MDVDRWERADRAWTEALAGDIGRGDMARASRYGALCRAEVQRRANGAPPPRAVPAPDPAPVDVPEVSAPSLKVPTYLMPDSPPRAAAFLADVDVESTMEAAMDGGGTLPFGPKATPAFEAWLGSSAPPSPRPTAPVGGDDDVSAFLNGTAIVVPGAVGAPALPFHPSAAADPAMPVEQYASLCAALSVFPARTQAILARFGLGDDEARRGLDDAWRGAFARDPGALARWQELVTRFRAAMTTQEGLK
jgi:hypothetical protein